VTKYSDVVLDECPLYPMIDGSTDSELMFYLALSLGLNDDPIAAVEQMTVWLCPSHLPIFRVHGRRCRNPAAALYSPVRTNYGLSAAAVTLPGRQ
jgi:hypothetical protein